MFKKHLLFALVIITLFTFAAAECPNGCSSAGTCGPKDKCTCFKNRQGNDCSQHTCPFGYAHVDIPKGDLDMDGTVGTTVVITGSQVYPQGTKEKFPTNLANEGHFYAECSNQGKCDRTNGECECFDGYDGSSCQRASCPNDCSGHGTCESISELASDAAGTLAGDWIEAGAATYGLWDKKSTYGCKCDPWFYGPDCSARRCKAGVDPMYSYGTPLYDTQVIRVGVDAATDSGTLTGSFRLRFYDHYGESWITEKIAFTDTAATNAAAISGALTRLPNEVISGVTCESIGAITTLGHIGDFKRTGTTPTGVFVGCQFTNNPGRLRLMDIVDASVLNDAVAATTLTATVSGSSVRGEDTDWAAQVSNQLIGTAMADADLTLNTAALDATYFGAVATATVTTHKLVKLGKHYLIATNAANPAYDIAYKWPGGAVAVSTKVYVSAATLNTATDCDAFNVGDNFYTYTASSGVVRGNIIMIENQIFYVTKDDTTNLKVYVDRPFNGDSTVTSTASLSAATKVYIITLSSTGAQTYNYVSECSGRGLCDSDTGICTCFKGYTRDNCDTQNILAF